MAEDTEYLKLPLMQRCTHKLWKARVHGFTEAVKLFQEEEDDKAAVFGQFVGLLGKFVGDSNVAAQEKGLEATLYFVQCSALAGKTVKDVMPTIIAKSIAASKKSTQDLSAQIALMYIEVEKQEAVIEELVKGLEHKNPKIVAACLSVLTMSLREFGTQVVGIKPLLKPVLGLLENRDKTVRDEAKVLVVEIYRWVGEAIKPQLSKLQPIQLTELETEFAKIKGEKAIPTRYLRSQQAKKAKAEAQAIEEVDGDDSGGPAVVAVDPMSLIDAVNILSKIPNDFYEKLEAKKWQERKEAVEALDQILDYPKFEKGDYGDLVRALLKVVSKDTNVVVVGIATKCLARLASGLKRGFQPYANSCISQLLAKFKEKKANVVNPLRDAVDAAFIATNLEAIQEDVIASLDSKNPSIKAETASFLGRCFAQCTPTVLNKKLLKSLTTVLVKTLNEPDPTVRDNSAEALGVAMKVVGEKVILPFLPDIDPLKLAKIKECCEKAVVKNVAPVKAVPVKPSAPPPKAEPPKKVLSGGAAKQQAVKVSKPVEPVEKEMTSEEVDEKAAEYLPEDVLQDLSSIDWKKRLEKMEIFENALTNLEPSGNAAEVMVKVMAKKPGFKDNNFQVLKIKFDCLKLIAETFPVTKPVVELVVADVTEKLADPKNGVLAGETLMALAEATNLDIVGNLVLEYAFSQKSVKIQQEALDWIGEAVQNFGLILSTATLITYMKKGLNSTNAAVRQSAAGLAGIISLYLGQQLLKLLDEKPTVVALVTAEIEKLEGEEPLEPSRTTKISRSAESLSSKAETTRVKVQQEEEEPEEPVKEEKAKPMARVDIGPKITEQLLAELGDKNWKVRSEALVTLQSIVTDAKAIKSNLGELPPALALRFVDSNAKLTVMALELCTSLATALGPNAKNVVRSFSRGIFTALGDNKPPVRSAALTCLNTWATEAGAKEFFSGEIIPDTLKTGSTSLKVELWNWLGETLPTQKGLPKDELCLIIPYLFAGLEDRSPDVRKAANSAVGGVMLHVGYGNMLKEVEKLKPASKAGILTTLEKVRPEVPDCTPMKVKPEGKGKAPSKTVPSSAKKASIVAPVKPTSRKKEEEIDTSPLLQVNKLKHQRMNDEVKLKVIKWNFTSPRPEFVELLRDQMTTAGFNKNLISNMFHTDFKFHLKALESLVDDLENEDALISNLDLILKWLTLRFFDTNPSVLLKGLDYLQTAFSALIDGKYTMSDIEVTSFIPYLVLKVGDPKDTVRDRVHAIMKQISQMYIPRKLFLLIMDGLKSKNSRQRTECLEELGYLIEEFGTSVCLPSPAAALKEISRQIADRDNAVRSAALNAIVKAYFVDGDKIYKMIGQLSDKDMSYLEERIKRASQNRMKTMREERSVLVAKRDDRKMTEQEPDIEEEEEELEKEPPMGEEPEVKEVPVRQQPSPRVVPSTYKFPERPATKIPELDLVEIDCSFLEKPVYIPENILRKMEKIPPANPAFESVLRDVSSLNLEVAFEGLKKLYSTIISPDVGDMLVPYSKNIFTSLNAQLKACNQFTLATHGPVLAQVYKIILRTIGDIFGKSQLAVHADEHDLKTLIHEMVVTFVENKTADFPENCYNQWILVFLSKVLTMSDRTAVTCAIVNELFDLVGNPPANQKITDLTTKCLLKVITLLKKETNLDEVINLDKVFYSCHLFMQSYPRYTWKDRPSDMPLKGIKTLLLHLVQMKGPDIMVHLRGIENPITSELSAYVKRMLVNKPISQVTKAMSEHLSEVFMKIGSEEHVKEGMIELYEFKKAHPEVDLTPIISATSQHFQDFVSQSLREIEKERGPLKKGNDIASATQCFDTQPNTVPIAHSAPPTDIQQMPQYYLNCLRNHQKRLGMPLSNLPGFEPADPNSNQ